MLRAALKEHVHFIIVVTLLTLAVTFPTIAYMFKTDVFWLPTGSSHDVYIKLWDIWYGKQWMTGQADRFYTDLMFYPDGVSLTYHPFFIPHVIVVHILSVILPLSNAYSFAHLLIIWTSAFSAYVYFGWLFKDKWIALFGAVVFGLSPHVLSHPNHPEIAFLAPVPMILYFLQRGLHERRSAFAVFSGLLLGLTTVTSMYLFVCAALTVGLVLCAYAVSKWKERWYWRFLFFLIAAAALSSLWRVYPLTQDTRSLHSAIDWQGYGPIDGRSDLISNFAQHLHPVYGPLVETILQTPLGAKVTESRFLGYLPLFLVGLGLRNTLARRDMLPWLALGAVFLILSLGPTLNVNGSAFEFFRLPAHYLDRLFPYVFGAFADADMYMMGLLLPFAVLACYGLASLQRARPITARPLVVIIFVSIVSFEYFVPARGGYIPRDQFDFIDWLGTEGESDEIRLINLPMGRKNAKRYNLYQALSGYPQAEGAISRTPDSAFDYIRANSILAAWYRESPVACNIDTRYQYLSALDLLETDGFSHVVFHKHVGSPHAIVDSFLAAAPSYSDDYVSIYRLSDLRESCPA